MTDQSLTTEDVSSAPRHRYRYLAIISLLVVIGVATAGYVKLMQQNNALARDVAVLQKQNITSEQVVTSLQSSMGTFQQSVQKSQDLSVKQEQMIADWQAAQKGNMEKWYVAEAQYLVRLANDQLQFTHNASMALSMLQRADQVLQNLQTNNLLDIRKSIAADIAALQAAPQADITELYLRVNALDQQLDQLPLPASPLKPEAMPMPATDYKALSWWKAGLLRTWEGLHKIVIVRNSGYATLPLVLPEAKTYLYQNLHSQMQSTMWAVMYYNAAVYQASLTRLINWIHEYLDLNAATTKAMLEQLTALQQITIQPPAINLTETLQQFEHYFAQPEPTPAVQ